MTKKKESKIKTPVAVNVSMLSDINDMVDSFVDIPRSAFPQSLREYAQNIQAELIELRASMISAKDWHTHCIDDKELY